MVNILDKVFGQEFSGKPIAGSGLATLKQSAGQAALAVSAPLAVSSGLLKTAVTALTPAAVTISKSAASSVGKFVQANPIKSVVGGLIGFGAVKQNPEILTKAPSKLSSGLVNVGENIGEFSKQPSVSSALDIYKQNPFIAGGLTAAGLGLTAKVAAPVIGSLLQTSAVKSATEAIKDLGVSGVQSVPVQTLPVAASQSPLLSGMPATSSYPEPNTQLVSYSDKAPVAYRKRKKPKSINNRAISIRNNILIANNNG